MEIISQINSNIASGVLSYNPETDYFGVINPNTGQWKNLVFAGFNWDGHLFKNGDEYTDITGGWSGNAYSYVTSEYTVKSGIISDNNLYLTNQGTSSITVMGTQNLINFEGKKTLHIAYTFNQGSSPAASVYVNASKTLDKAGDKLSSVALSNGTNEAILNTVGIESGYIIIWCGGANNRAFTLNIPEVRLE